MDFIVQDGIRTYEDISNFYLAQGWGCKSCGQLQSESWYQCSGDTHCKRCTINILEPLGDVDIHEYPRAKEGETILAYVYQGDAFGFEYAEYQRKEFERIYGNQPWSWYTA